MLILFKGEVTMPFVPEVLQSAIVGMMIAIPTVMIYKKAGLNPWWAALVFLPVFGLLLVFMQLALQAWPNAKQER
jgi:hypothetical protein